MPFDLLVDEAAVLPLRAVAFQSLLLLVAIALEAGMLRQRLRLGFQVSIRYAATLNLLAVCLGWVVFLGLEPLAPPPLRTQIISYILFGRFYNNALSGSLGPIVVAAGLGIFFLTFLLKVKGLEWLSQLLGNPIAPNQASTPSRYPRFKDLRRDQNNAPRTPAHALAVLHANALSFTAVLVLLLLRYGLEVTSL
jgi:hypothetical protein